MSIAGFLKPHLIACSVTLLAATVLTGCGGGGGSSTTTVADESYNGPGSIWNITLAGGGTFNIDRSPAIGQTPNMTIQGNYTRQANGFITMTVTGGSSTSIPADNPPNNATAWAVEIPGYAFMLKPTSTDDQIITMVSAGNCPTADFDGNFVVVKKDLTLNGDSGADIVDRDFFGTFNYNFSTSTPSLTTLRSLTNTFPTIIPDVLPAGTCSNGIMTFTDTAVYLTSNGGAIVHLGTSTETSDDDSFLFSLQQKAITDISNLQGEYAGILFDQNANVGEQVSPVQLSCDTGGTCTGSILSDVINSTILPNATATINLTGNIDAIGPGLITGTIDLNSATGNMACMADINALNSGKRIISCVSQSPENNAMMFNVIFVSI